MTIRKQDGHDHDATCKSKRLTPNHQDDHTKVMNVYGITLFEAKPSH